MGAKLLQLSNALLPAVTSCCSVTWLNTLWIDALLLTHCPVTVPLPAIHTCMPFAKRWNNSI